MATSRSFAVDGVHSDEHPAALPSRKAAGMQARNHADAEGFRRPVSGAMRCPVAKCDRLVEYGGRVCSMHRARWERYGSWELPPGSKTQSYAPAFERWRSKLDMSGGPDACWIWTGALNKSGYGNFWDGERYIAAHRYGLEQKIGRRLRDDEEAAHSCDNPPCCNPCHLAPESPSENFRDAQIRRRFHGFYGPRSKFTLDDLRYIVANARRGTYGEIAKRYGVHYSTLRRIVRGDTFKNLRALISSPRPATAERSV